ncbi:type VI secretion system ATPase TssH [Limnobacter humi]|uniref:Type VI secretion system ATPase TssH n=1 Tax=Limnobacter humi TaxID=1778671 RepID=A0ABT1WE22_9BURK|nr:type VI secretion system ATPase TssH [Limnobacter humi]MCQ8895765.1 type VI secretion system ATPase TssH [Limnobacter humi]
MTGIRRAALFGKLNATAFKTLEGATTLCKLRGNAQVEWPHWLMQILQQDDSDWHCVLRACGVDLPGLLTDVQRALDMLPGGAQCIRDLSEDLTHLVERAWLYASLKDGCDQIRTGHLLLALLDSDRLKTLLQRCSAQFRRLDPEQLRQHWTVWLGGSPEAGLAIPPTGAVWSGDATGAAMPAAQLGAEAALKRYTTDLTAQARAGELDPVTGRDVEIAQVVDILLRRRQNNPLITGEAGVGKTAVVEGLAQQIVQGQVPPSLKTVRLLSLDMGLLQAGASMKGEFEQRLRQVIDEVQASEQPTVLFIDEVHILVGAGGQQGTGDAANLLKPALARGHLRTIGATTWSEYKQYIEKDPALTRRFQVVQVVEPSDDVAIRMLRGVVAAMQAHHGVLVLDEAVQAAVRLSRRYIPARQLPDKAIALLDTACARVAVSQHASPPAVQQLRRRCEALQQNIDQLMTEIDLGIVHAESLDSKQAELGEVRISLEQAEARHAQAMRLLNDILALHRSLQGDADDSDRLLQDRANLRAQLTQLEQRLAVVQGEQPMVFSKVDAQCVATVVSDWTGIPLGNMLRDEVSTVLSLANHLGQRVVGQTHALQQIARRIQTSRAGLDDPDKPKGVFLLAGTSGVGKTETALALAEQLYGGSHNLITINMSEYQEAHTVSTLKGAPPGYVGYGQGGVLTEAVRRRPHSVVLLDEVEKAHPDVHELFFQVFDKGWMDDGEGRRIDFRNTLILLTTNVGTSQLMALCEQGRAQPAPELLVQALRQPLLSVFPPALLGRLDVVPYYPLSPALLARIVRLQLSRVAERLARVHQLTVTIDDALVEHLVACCTESDSGARLVGSLISNQVLPGISQRLLKAMLDQASIAQVTLTAGPQGVVAEYA